MATITKAELKKHILDALEQGLGNKDIADYLNEKFNVPEDQSIPPADVPFYKEKVGLKGVRPKKKKFFTIIEDDVAEFEDPPADEVSAEELPPATEYSEEAPNRNF